MRPFCGTYANSTDPDQRPHNAAFNQGLHCSLTQGSSKTSINLISRVMIRLHMLCLLLACNIKIIFLTTLIEFVMKCIKVVPDSPAYVQKVTIF